MPIKTRQQLIKKYIDFFKSKSHKEIPSASLIPEHDPTVLFTTSGMHPLVLYLIGQPHPLGKRIVNIQKCVRTGDIEEVGDPTHHTFFEMLGNWSFGDYWKEDSIRYYFEFLASILLIPIEKIAISCFKGDKDAPKDTESEKVWLELGIPKERIAFRGKEDNWWGPTGNTGPCGPDIEIFYWIGKSKAPNNFNPKDKNWIEIGTDVLMEYNKNEKGKYQKLKQKNVDFGGGVERTLAILNNLEDDYLSTTFLPIIKQIEKISGKKYKESKKTTREMRIIVDHIKAATFILGDERAISPSNLGQGYVLRRLIRRAIRYGKQLGINENFTAKVAQEVFPIYPDYPELKKNRNFILTNLDEEENKFRKTLEKGLREYEKFAKNKKITAEEGFLLFQSHGFPIEMTDELAKKDKIKYDPAASYALVKKHQELSRTATTGMFRSGLADESEQTTKLHTATHLLNAALQKVLGPEVKQRGSNITPERLRFDFNFPRKLTEKELKEVESLINKKIKQALHVKREEMSLNKALDLGAQAEFGHKYPEMVSVYTISDPKDKKGFFSKEICTGPHVSNTKEIGKFKIVKEQSSAAGIRRIKAIIK